MKKCHYCGQENPDDAVKCSRCGTKPTDSQGRTLPQDSPSTQKRFSFPCFVVAFLVGSIVSGMCLYTAWQNIRPAPLLSREQYITCRAIEEIRASINDYTKSNAVPKTLDELPDAQKWRWQFPLEDGWGRPLIYTVNGTNWLVTSYGRDAKPGGIGLDCDLTSSSLRPKESLPTLHQFVFDLPTSGAIWGCFICGLAAFLLALFTLKPPLLTRQTIFVVIFKLGLTIIGTLIAGSMITAVHVPSGH